jgi:hypothetical protein
MGRDRTQQATPDLFSTAPFRETFPIGNAMTFAYAPTLTGCSVGSVIDVRRGRCFRTSSGK